MTHERLTAKDSNSAQTPEPISSPDTVECSEQAASFDRTLTDVSSNTNSKPPVGRGPSLASSSLANDIAMARGIPARPANGKPITNRETTPTIPPSHNISPLPTDPSTSRLHDTSAVPTSYQKPNNSSKYDEAFEEYYNTIQGLVSRLSAPLAFPSMPLFSRFFAQDTRPSKSAKFAKTLPDIRRLISPAALEAVNDRKYGDPTEESFYVVSRPDVEPVAYKDTERKPGEWTSDDELANNRGRDRTNEASLHSSQHPTSSQSSSQLPRKTREGLLLENRMLQELADNLAKRLNEVNASHTAGKSNPTTEQNLRPSPYAPSDNAPYRSNGHSLTFTGAAAGFQQTPGDFSANTRQHPGANNAAQTQQAQDLERQLEQTEEKLARVLRENAKMKSRWDDLLKGARMRRNEANISGDKDKAPRKDSSLRGDGT